MRNRENNQYQPDPDDDLWSDADSANTDQDPVIAFGMSIWLPNYGCDRDGNELPKEDQEKSEWEKLEDEWEQVERGVDDEGCERDDMTCLRAFWIPFTTVEEANDFREVLEAIDSEVAGVFGMWLAYAKAKAKVRNSPKVELVRIKRRPDADE